MNKKILYGFLPIFLSLVVLFVPIRAAAANGYVGKSNISHSFYKYDTYVPLVNTYVSEYGMGNDSILPEYVYATYKGTSECLIKFTNLEPSFFYNGYYFLVCNLDIPVVNGASVESEALNVKCTSLMDGVNVYVHTDARSSGTVTYEIGINFDCFNVNLDTIYIPLVFEFEMSVKHNNTASENVMPSYTLNFRADSFTSSNTVYEYSDLSDIPNVEGYYANQNNEIIMNQYEQKGLLQQVNSWLSDIFNRLKNNSDAEINQGIVNSQAEINQGIVNSQAQINQSIENSNQITNGYTDQSIDNADNVFNRGAGDLADIEDDLSSSSSQYIDNYSDSAFDTSFLDTIAPSLNFVVTWFTNFWQIGGGLTATYTLSFAIFIAFYIIRVRA